MERLHVRQHNPEAVAFARRPSRSTLFVAITNTPRAYDWGSRSQLQEMLGIDPSGDPAAELWLGAHPGSPSRILAPSEVGGARDLAEWLAVDRARALGESAKWPSLPFLMKILAAARPLSLQAHPNAEQAKKGFAREQAAGIAIDSPRRNYRDDRPKPEVIIALEDGFEALCGFRPTNEAQVIVNRMLAVDPTDEPLREFGRRVANLPETFSWLSRRGVGVTELVARVAALARLPKMTINAPILETDHSARDSILVSDALSVARVLAEEFPGDVGIVASLLLNHVTLRRGEALFLPAGNIHAYLYGLGVEVMTASDNVLRGGMTNKHVDVDELLGVLEFTPGPPPYLMPNRISSTLEMFQPDIDDFAIAHITGKSELSLVGPAIAFCVAGEVSLSGRLSSGTLARGQGFYLTSDEGLLSFSGSGEVFVAMAL